MAISFEGDKTIFAIFEIIWFPSNSEYVGSMNQFLASCWKLCGHKNAIYLAINIVWIFFSFFLTIFEWLNHTFEAQVVIPIDGFVFESED